MNVHERIRKLERANRLARLFLIVMVSGAILLGATDQRRVEVMTLRAQRFELIDPIGNVIGTWGSEDDATFLNFESGNGDALFQAACANDQSAFDVTYSDNKASLLSTDEVSAFWAHNPNTGNAFLRTSDKSADMTLYDESGQVRVFSCVSPDNGTDLVLYGKARVLDGATPILWDARTR